jgi:hypothetical protein
MSRHLMIPPSPRDDSIPGSLFYETEPAGRPFRSLSVLHGIAFSKIHGARNCAGGAAVAARRAESKEISARQVFERNTDREKFLSGKPRYRLELQALPPIPIRLSK